MSRVLSDTSGEPSSAKQRLEHERQVRSGRIHKSSSVEVLNQNRFRPSQPPLRGHCTPDDTEMPRHEESMEDSRVCSWSPDHGQQQLEPILGDESDDS